MLNEVHKNHMRSFTGITLLAPDNFWGLVYCSCGKIFAHKYFYSGESRAYLFIEYKLLWFLINYVSMLSEDRILYFCSSHLGIYCNNFGLKAQLLFKTLFYFNETLLIHLTIQCTETFMKLFIISDWMLRCMCSKHSSADSDERCKRMWW